METNRISLQQFKKAFLPMRCFSGEMESMDSIRMFYPPVIAENKAFNPMILNEYIQCQTLEYLSRQPDTAGMAFIDGTCLRLVHGINRFSEDLDSEGRTDFCSLCHDSGGCFESRQGQGLL